MLQTEFRESVMWKIVSYSRVRTHTRRRRRGEDWRNSIKYKIIICIANTPKIHKTNSAGFDLKFRRSDERRIKIHDTANVGSGCMGGGGWGKIENVKLAGKQAIRENNINRPLGDGRTSSAVKIITITITKRSAHLWLPHREQSSRTAAMIIEIIEWTSQRRGFRRFNDIIARCGRGETSKCHGPPRVRRNPRRDVCVVTRHDGVGAVVSPLIFRLAFHSRCQTIFLFLIGATIVGGIHDYRPRFSPPATTITGRRKRFALGLFVFVLLRLIDICFEVFYYEN